MVQPDMQSQSRPSIHVLVVDDSAVVRQVMAALISYDPDMTVAVAADPMIAEAKMRQQRPDVIVLDLELPVMDGLSWLRKLMAHDPLPVIVCSVLTGTGAKESILALEEGAVEVVSKPRLGVREFLVESERQLLGAIRAAARARLPPPRQQSQRAAPGPLLSVAAVRPPAPTADQVIAIGASTGGPQALHALLASLPPWSPGVIVAQHMPGGFTGAFARRMDELCQIEVREASPGDLLIPGRALIAPGGRHLMLRKSNSEYRAQLSDSPPVCGHRPSVDVLFRSVARVAGASALGVLLTGMGTDGAEGLLELRQQGAATIAESEDTCVVFGMPKAALSLSGDHEVLPLSEIAPKILRWSLAPDSEGRTGESIQDETRQEMKRC